MTTRKPYVNPSYLDSSLLVSHKMDSLYSRSSQHKAKLVVQDLHTQPLLDHVVSCLFIKKKYELQTGLSERRRKNSKFPILNSYEFWNRLDKIWTNGVPISNDFDSDFRILNISEWIWIWQVYFSLSKLQPYLEHKNKAYYVLSLFHRGQWRPAPRRL